MRIQTLLAGAAMALVASAAAVSASAAELVTNGGFETGDTSGWTLTGNPGFSFVTAPGHSGQFAYFNGAVGSSGVLSQTLATVAGQSYDFSFWLQNDGGTPNSFTASLGGVTLATFANAPGFAYTLFSGSVVAASDNGTLSFAFQQDPAYWRLDDVSLVSGAGGVPEPAAWGLMLIGFLGAGGAIRAGRRRQAAAAA